jgi:hypothetical protein
VLGEPAATTAGQKSTRPAVDFPALSNIHIDIKSEL